LKNLYVASSGSQCQLLCIHTSFYWEEPWKSLLRVETGVAAVAGRVGFLQVIEYALAFDGAVGFGKLRGLLSLVASARPLYCGTVSLESRWMLLLVEGSPMD
jgi:hypothetical protein